jgi:formyl-CoA transferase
MRLLGQSINMSRTPEHVDRATPELGEHSDEIMRELGYSDEQIGALRSERII